MRTGIEESFETVGDALSNRMPKLKVGSKEPVNDPFVDKMKKWLLIGLTFLIGGGAALLVIIKLLGRIF